MKIYIAGKITGNPNYRREFYEAAGYLTEGGNHVMNPAILPDGFDYEDYMTVGCAMLQVCDAIFLLTGWKGSPGAQEELRLAKGLGKVILYQEG